MRAPLVIDITKTEAVNTPQVFQGTIRAAKINVLPLVHDRKASHGSGWCTYTYEHDQAPELEVICGGINSQTPKAGAIWRQGNLLHFGFEPSPDQMTEAGKALLVNAICYVSRFTEDRPIVRTPKGERVFDRGVVGRLLDNPDRDVKELAYYLEKESFTKLAGKSRKEIGEWYERVHGYLHAGMQGGLSVDADALAMGVSPASPDFFEKAVALLTEPDRATLARTLLGRYPPDGAGADAPAESWRSWSRENMSFLFFSDAGGYRWYIDPLAKRRGTPTARLRGDARATLLALAPSKNSKPSAETTGK